MAISNAEMDLVLDVAEWEGMLKGRIDYNSDLFNCSTVERMAGHLQAGTLLGNRQVDTVPGCNSQSSAKHIRCCLTLCCTDIYGRQSAYSAHCGAGAADRHHCGP